MNFNLQILFLLAYTDKQVVFLPSSILVQNSFYIKFQNKKELLLFLLDNFTEKIVN